MQPMQPVAMQPMQPVAMQPMGQYGAPNLGQPAGWFGQMQMQPAMPV